MYAINKLGRPVLITPSEVLFHAPTDQQIDERQILNNIIVAEERWISNVMGDAFYEDFITKKNRKVTTANQQEIVDLINTSLPSDKQIGLTAVPVGSYVNAIEFITDEWYIKLWERFLWKLTAECVDVTAVIPSWVRHTSAGQMKNNPNVIGGNGSNSASAEMNEVQLKITRTIQDRIDPLIERMRMWMCRNQNKFPHFRFNCGGYGCGEGADGTLDGISHVRKTNFITNIYEDLDHAEQRPEWLR